MVVYQVYPRSFADADGDGVGDLGGVAAHLDHLAWLGVDALWLSPINPSPMADGGYDVADYRGVDPAFGTVEDVERLAAAAAEHGIKLLLDVVPCHTSIEHPWFRERPELYVWSPVDGPPNNWRGTFGGPAWSEDPHGRGWYLHSFYPEQPDLDWRNPEVAREMGDVLAFWRSKGVAGFRLDALQQLLKDPELRDDPAATAPSIMNGHPEHEALEHRFSSDQPGVEAALRALRAGAGEDAFLVGEVGLPSGRHPRYLEHLDASFCFELFFAAWDAEALAAGIRAGLETGKASWVLSNHDFPRLAERIGRHHVAAAALLLLTLPGPVFLFQGDELALGNGPGRPAGAPEAPPYDRAGRDAFRHPRPWTAEAPHHGFTTGTPWLEVVTAPEGSAAEQRATPGSPARRVRDLIALRRTLDGPLEDLTVRDGVLSFRRGDHVIAVNTTDAPRPFPAAGAVVASTGDRSDGHLAAGVANVTSSV
ncbi:MAG: alpha-amylase [Solirubrobacterales bacterium]|nr:alpha-amylase [Solirubrobacterales bacterium]